MGFVHVEPSLLRELELARLRTRINEHHQGPSENNEVLVHTEYHLQRSGMAANYDDQPVIAAPSANMAGCDIPHIPQVPDPVYVN